MDDPRLSVLIPNYNHGRFLPETLDGLLAQTYRPAEIIVLDDGSTDDSHEILREYAQRYPFIRVVFNERNMGVEYTVNRLLTLCDTDYIYFMGADDITQETLLAKSMAMVAKYPQAAFCSALCRRFTEDGEDLGLMGTPIVADKPVYFPPEEVRRLLGRHGSWLHGLTMVHRREAFIAAGGLIPELGAYADGFLYQVLALRHGACFIPEPLAGWRKLDTGYASTTVADAGKSRSIIDYAAQLIDSPEYRVLFPPGYSRTFRRLQLFWLGSAALEALEATQDHCFKQIALVRAQPSSLDQPVLRLLRSLVRIPTLGAMLYLFVKNFNVPLARFIFSWLFGKGRRMRVAWPSGRVDWGTPATKVSPPCQNRK